VTLGIWDVALYAGALLVLFLTPGPVWVGLIARTLKWVAAGMFVVMGALVIRSANQPIDTDGRLTRPGMWAGFISGLIVILGNPKAILFYAGMLPGFFDLTQLTPVDITIIVALSMVVPLIGNLAMAAFIDRARRLMASPRALRQMNISAGILLIGVGLIIPLT